ncbi:signal peptidase I [Lacicoccus qingdaonensis]|uniref:Signal peptidase I n=1 Tax=Lacicoccus qingdaonensis TaxID=576118 RepID=A0A1G9EDM5_9BACL|nr:signal peptidase I [Salinicoccus qingdaonensis]SDK74145.1 type I signal peptidase. Serine peptidase. MEROPS family S26A [Salinicoccus qingdaonensis]
MKKEIMEWLVAIAVAVILIVVIRTFFFVSYTVDGLSMDPTFKDGDRVVVNKIMDNFQDYEYEDVIVFDSEMGPAYVKRVIGAPGDTVEMEDKQVYLNGEALEEDYVVHTEDSYMDNFTLEDLGVEGDVIPEDHYLVLGDNRPISRDGRDFGLIHEDSIVGEVSLRFWPLNEIAFNFD